MVIAIADTREVSHRDEEPMPIRPESKRSEEPRDVTGQAGDDPSTSGGPSPSGQPAAEPDRSERPHLEIASFRLISRVKDFGSFEPVNPDTLKPGQRVRVYCEMAGLEYQSRGDAFVSRLAAYFELRSGADGPVVWEQAPGIAEDKCHRPRRDYYVSYVVEFPTTLEPGPYRLRLIQTDLVGNRATSSELPLTIVR